MKTSNRSIGAAVIALVLGLGAAGGSLPAQAQTFNFGFGFGLGSDEDRFPRRICIPTDRGLRNAIADQGYHNIYLNVPIGRYVQARATRGNWVYLLRVNVCSGEIVDRDRLRRS